MHWTGIAARMARGDASALAELYDATARELFSLALAVLADRGPAEQAVERCLLRIVRLAPNLSADADLSRLARAILAADLGLTAPRAPTSIAFEAPLLPVTAA
jgi:DNA-directed RNA polymerase specialized sigma24 family protein